SGRRRPRVSKGLEGLYDSAFTSYAVRRGAQDPADTSTGKTSVSLWVFGCSRQYPEHPQRCQRMHHQSTGDGASTLSAPTRASRKGSNNPLSTSSGGSTRTPVRSSRTDGRVP